MLIDFLLQQWLHERALMLRHTYTACLVSNIEDTFKATDTPFT